MTADHQSSSQPRWSPDGKYLAFLSARDEGKTQLWLLNRFGGEAQRLTDTAQDVDDVAWSPDGRRLVVVLRDPSPEELDEARDRAKDQKDDQDSDEKAAKEKRKKP